MPLYPQVKPEPQLFGGVPLDDDALPFTDAAKDEICFSTFSDLHSGQTTVCEPKTNSSKLLSHSVHLYSNIGIF